MAWHFEKGTIDGVDVAGLPGGSAARVATPLLSLVVARRRRRGVLLAGTVRPGVLESAAVELMGTRR